MDFGIKMKKKDEDIKNLKIYYEDVSEKNDEIKKLIIEGDNLDNFITEKK